MRKSKPTILVIDNDEGLAATIAARLEARGYRTIRAASGAQGVAEFQSGGVDLVITDLNMPAGNGVALAQTLRKSSGVPIIVVTGFHADFSRELRSIENLTVIRKPFTAQQLLEVVEADLALAGGAVTDAGR